MPRGVVGRPVPIPRWGPYWCATDTWRRAAGTMPPGKTTPRSPVSRTPARTGWTRQTAPWWSPWSLAAIRAKPHPAPRPCARPASKSWWWVWPTPTPWPAAVRVSYAKPGWRWWRACARRSAATWWRIFWSGRPKTGLTSSSRWPPLWTDASPRARGNPSGSAPSLLGRKCSACAQALACAVELCLSAAAPSGRTTRA